MPPIPYYAYRTYYNCFFSNVHTTVRLIGVRYVKRYVFSDNKKQELNELDVHTFTIEKVMARRDIEKISIDNGYKEKEFFEFWKQLKELFFFQKG